MDLLEQVDYKLENNSNGSIQWYYDGSIKLYINIPILYSNELNSELDIDYLHFLKISI